MLRPGQDTEATIRLGARVHRPVTVRTSMARGRCHMAVSTALLRGAEPGPVRRTRPSLRAMQLGEVVRLVRDIASPIDPWTPGCTLRVSSTRSLRQCRQEQQLVILGTVELSMQQDSMLLGHLMNVKADVL